MGSSANLSFDELTAPIAGDKPTGIDLRIDSPIWQQIKHVHGQGRTDERQAAKSAEGGDPWHVVDWKPCNELIIKTLKENTKDTEIASWLLDGMTCEHGFRGLADVLHLVSDLMEKYWDAAYPPLSEGPADRVKYIAALNGNDRPGTLIDRINNIALTNSAMVGPYDRSDYQQAIDLEGVTEPERRAARIAAGTPTLDQFTAAIKGSDGKFLQDLHDDIKAASEEIARFEKILGEKAAGEVQSPTNYVQEALAECRKVLETVAGVGLTSAAQAESAPGGAPAAGGGSRTNVSMAAGAIGSREDAFARIRDIARYFRETEPQSPVSYALEQVIRWGKMPLPELLTELIRDEAPRSDLFRMVGLPKTETAAAPSA